MELEEINDIIIQLVEERNIKTVKHIEYMDFCKLKINFNEWIDLYENERFRKISKVNRINPTIDYLKRLTYRDFMPEETKYLPEEHYDWTFADAIYCTGSVSLLIWIVTLLIQEGVILLR